MIFYLCHHICLCNGIESGSDFVSHGWPKLTSINTYIHTYSFCVHGLSLYLVLYALRFLSGCPCLKLLSLCHVHVLVLREQLYLHVCIKCELTWCMIVKCFCIILVCTSCSVGIRLMLVINCDAWFLLEGHISIAGMYLVQFSLDTYRRVTYLHRVWAWYNSHRIP